MDCKMGRNDKPHEFFSMRIDAGLHERLKRYVESCNVYERAHNKRLTTKTGVIEEALYEYLNAHDAVFNDNIEMTETNLLIQIRNDIDKFLKFLND